MAMPIVKIKKKYINIATAMLIKKIDAFWFGSIKIKENKGDEFAWILFEGDDAEDFSLCGMPQKIKNLLKDF